MKLQLNSIKVSTRVMGDGRLEVTIADKDRYLVSRKNTSNGLLLTHYIMQILAPVLAVASPPGGDNVIGKWTASQQELIMAFSQGVGDLGPLEFIKLAKFLLESVVIAVGTGDKAVEKPAESVFETHFANNLDHLGVLMVQVVAHSGVFRFFSGLGTSINTLSPEAAANESQPTSPQA